MNHNNVKIHLAIKFGNKLNRSCSLINGPVFFCSPAPPGGSAYHFIRVTYKCMGRGSKGEISNEDFATAPGSLTVALVYFQDRFQTTVSRNC